METLEPRALLSGDHPGFPVPFTPTAPSTVIMLDGMGNATVNGTIAAGDTGDFFRFTVTTPDFVRVLANTAGMGSTLNSRVQVFDSTGTLVAQGNDNGEITSTAPLRATDGWAGFVPLAAGDYFILVTGQFSTTGNYELRVGTQTTDVAGIDTMTGDATAMGTIARVQDDVFFHVDIPANVPMMADFNSVATVVATVDLMPPVTMRLDTRLEIFDANGSPIPNANDSDTGYLTGAFTTWRVSENTRYYVRVRSDKLSGTQAVGDFSLNFDFAAAELNNPVDPVTRRGDDTTQLLFTPFDTRLFRFRAEGTGLTFITVRDPDRDGAFGLRLYDINGTLLAFDDDFIGTEPQIEIPLRGGEEFFIVVDSFEPPPTPIPIAPVGIQVFVEAHSTYDGSQPVDDHIDRITTGTPGQIRRQFEEATPLTFGAPHLIADANEGRNPALDHSYVIDATATGRIYDINDSDLFSFTAPLDMLGGYGGNNDDVGSALYVGGSFNVADPNSLAFSPPRGVTNVPSRGLATFDAGSWWFAGPQGLALDGSQLGFIDNPLTPATAGPEIYAMTVWDPDGPDNGFFGPMLVIGGDFILNIDDPTGTTVLSLANIAIWCSLTPVATNGNPSGYSWTNAPLNYGLIAGSANGPVRALAAYDLDGMGPGVAQLFAGGDFTTIGAAPWAMPPIAATPASHIARFGGTWTAMGTGLTGAGATVRALTVYNPPDPGTGNPSGMPPVPDPPDMPEQLVIGGTFTTAGPVAANNIVFWGSASPGTGMTPPPAPTYNPLGSGVTGNNNMNTPGGSATGVYALSEWDPPDPMGATAVDRVLLVGGNFTTAGGNAGTNNFALYGAPAPPPDDMTNPRLLWLKDLTGVRNAMPTPGTNAGVNNTVFAVAAWDPPDITGFPPVDPVVLIGGAFTMSGTTATSRMALYTGVATNAALGVFNNTVRTISIMRTDTQEQGIPQLAGVDDDREVPYIGGDFTMIGAGMFGHLAQLDVRSIRPDIRIAVAVAGLPYAYTQLRQGVDTTVFALAQFDDENPLFDNSPSLWDRNDRAASRIDVAIGPTFGAFLDTAMRIYGGDADGDGSFDLIYSNVDRNPFDIPPDPSGSFDQALAPNLPNPGPKLWGGTTYYIEVVSNNAGNPAGRQHGRYNLLVTIDAYPPDVDMNGTPDDTLSQVLEVTNAGNWTAARRLNIDGQINGDTRNFSDTVGTFGPQWNGSQTIDGFGLGPASTRRRVFGQGPFDVQQSTPSGHFFAQETDYAAIETITDTDLYYFRANANGYIDIRVNSSDIMDGFVEIDYELDAGTITATRETEEQTVSSPLHSKLRVFNNDLQEIASNDYNPGVNGESSTTSFGTLGDRLFYHRDAAIVLPVVAGQVYFIQVESGELAAFLINPDDADQRRATGSYELVVNGLSDFNPDNSDDYTNITGQASPFPIDIVVGSPTNAQGTATGNIRDVINNPAEPNNDRDLFFYYATATGTVRLTAGANNGSSVALSIIVFDDTGVNQVVQGQALQGLSTTVTFFAVQGERFYFQVDGSGGSQGDYILSVVGTPETDDHADYPNYVDGTVRTIDRFLGTLTASGMIENPGDTDVFQFVSNQYVPALATIRVTSATPTSLNPRVRVYENQIDPSDIPYRAIIALNDDEVDPDNPTGPPLSEDGFARFSISPGQTYYIVVDGSDPNVDFGSYDIVVMADPTDDHPDFAAFPLASAVNLITNPSVGAVGNATGIIEIPEDDDVFRFTAPAGGTALAALTLPIPGAFEPEVRVYNNQQVLLVTGTILDLDGVLRVTFPVARNQTYYVVVDVSMGTPTAAAYTMQIIAPPLDDHANEGEFDLATQIFISSNTGIGTRTGEILPTTDTDLFRVLSRVTGALNITVTTPDGDLNPRIMVFNSARVLIAGSSDDTDTATQIVMAGAPNELYYILVLSDTTGGGNQSGTYTVTVSQTLGGGGPGPGPDQDDHPNAGDYTATNDVALDARTGDGTATGLINFVGDTDLFSFTTALLQAGVTGQRPVYLQITTPFGGLVDGIVRVYDNTPAHNLVASNSNGIPGATANLTFQATPGARYFVLVEPVASNLGSYVVRLDTEPNTHFSYYPEGYSASTINEFVPIVNPNDFAVTYTIIAHYETGVRDQILVSNVVIAPHSRGGHAISTNGSPGVSLVRRDTPYSLEIQSNGQLAATFSHYDFGITTGENFTNVLSTDWSFSEVHKDGLNFRDFAVFFNPNNTAAHLSITLVYDNGQTVTFNRTVDSLRRSGINFNNDSAINTEGRFALRITSDVPIVTALSSYRITGNRGGFGLLGNAVGGNTEGVVPLVSTSPTVNSSVSIYNSSTTTTASVTITATYLTSGLPDVVRIISVGAQARRTVTLAELGLVPNLTAGLRYDSSVPVTFTYTEYQNGDGDSTSAGTNAATTALFGDAFVNPASAGTTYIENLAIYNPAGFDTDVQIRFLFNDGTVSAPVLRRVTAGRYDVIRIDQQDAIRNHNGLAFFSIRVDAISPIITYFTHYDLFLNGGWSTMGAPVGLTTPLSTI